MFLGAIWFTWGWRFMGDVGKKPFKLEKTAEELEMEKQRKEEEKNMKHQR